MRASGSGDPAAGRSIARDSAESFVVKIAIYAVGFLGSILISRALGPEGRGVYYLPVVAAATLVSVGKLGLEQANVFLFGTAKIVPGRLSAQNGLVALVMGVGCVLLLLAAPRAFADLFLGTTITLLVLAGLSIPFSLHTQFTAGLMTMLGQVTWQFWAALIAGVIQVSVIIALFMADKITPEAVLATTLVSMSLTWLLVLARFRVPENPWLGWDGPLLTMTLKQSLPLHLGMVLLYLQLRADVFLVKAINGTTALGLYSVSVMLAETMYLAMDSIALAILPRQVWNRPEEAATYSLQAGRVVILLGGGVALLWIVFGWPIIYYLFGVSFLPAYLPLVILLPGLLALGVQRVCSPPLLRLGRPGRMAAVYALGLGVNVVLNLGLIPLWGIAGAAVSSMLSYLVGAFIFIRWTGAIAGMPWLAGVTPGRSDIKLVWSSTLKLLGLLLMHRLG
jgi:O-antigen/teichoic acid export membrane protein